MDVAQPIVNTRQPEEMASPFIQAGWKHKALSFGDYQFYDSIGEVVLIEDKTVDKLLADIPAGTLQKQCRGIIENSTFPILLIRGHWVEDNGYLLGSKYSWEQVWNLLQTLQDMGVRLQLVPSDSDAIERIFQLQKYYAKEFHSSASRGVAGNVKIAVLNYIDGISKVKAETILKSFGNSLRAIANADAETLAKVEGVGAKLASRIYEFWD